MSLVGLVLFACIVLATASPNARYIERMKEKYGARFSDDLYEDASLDVPELVRKYRYPLEEHSVTTEDGYILTMHRIPHGRDANNVPDPRKPAVLVLHGLASSSADFVVMGPGNSLAYVFAEEGFDVWLANARGNYYSRRHVRLNPDSRTDSSFWDFSWEQIGNFDLPAMIDYVLQNTNKEKLHYIGHSQGTTAFFVMGSLRPEYNDKIISMHAMAPVAYMAHNRHILFNTIAPFAKAIARLVKLTGTGEVLPNNELTTFMGQAMCRDGSPFQPICTTVVFLLVGWNEQQLNATMFPVKLGHAPAGASIYQVAHYGQGIVDKGFRRYDHGIIKNVRLYGSVRPPPFDLAKVTAPVILHYTLNDPLAEVPDVMRLYSELGAPVGMFRVSKDTFNHVDFIWGIDARTLIFDRIMNIMREMDNQS